MPSRTPPTLVKQIRHLRRKGLRHGEIADECGVSRSTVARYVAKVDADTVAELDAEDGVGSAADEVSDDDLERQLTTLVQLLGDGLGELVSNLSFNRCPACSEEIVAIESMVHLRCPSCLVELRAPTISPNEIAATVE